MKYVYQAKDLLGSCFRRVDVRITETMRDDVAGVGRLNDRIIWISEHCVRTYPDLRLRYLVFHELGHAIFGAKHDHSYLMQVAWPNEMCIEKQNKGLLRLAKKHRPKKD